MDFTREPIIQTVITPKEGCKIVVRSSKNSGQEEYFVDALEVVSFGSAIFYRSLERPKSFLVPVSDYEVLEVREARMVLKNVGVDRAIKIGGGRDAVVRGGRDHTHEKHEVVSEPEAEISEEANKTEAKTDARLDKKRDRRRNARRRRGRDDAAPKEGEEEAEVAEGEEKIQLPKPSVSEGVIPVPFTSVLTSLLPPPSTLISETIARYRDNVSFKNAFFSKEEPEDEKTADTEAEIESLPTVALEQPEYGTFEMSEEEEEEVYQQRQHLHEEPVVEEDPVAVEENVEEESKKEEPSQE